jgi:hypothetical protein
LKATQAFVRLLAAAMIGGFLGVFAAVMSAMVYGACLFMRFGLHDAPEEWTAVVGIAMPLIGLAVGVTSAWGAWRMFKGWNWPDPF